MMAGQSLFLLGGDTTIFEAVAEEFVPAAGGSGATIALLLAGGARSVYRIEMTDFETKANRVISTV
jgi:hypothetical protein